MKPRLIFSILAIAALLLVAYFMLSPNAIAKYFLYQPTKVEGYQDTVPNAVKPATEKDVTFSSESGATLHGFYFEYPNSKTTVLIHHGQGGNMMTHIDVAKAMMEAGQSAFLYDYEGFGMSTGHANNKSMLRDGDAAYRYLTDTQKLKPSSIINCGVSLGCGVACHVAESNPCGAVILINPYTSLHRAAVDRLPFLRFYPRSMFPQPDMGAIAFVKSNASVPTLFIQGSKDLVFGAEHARELDNMAKAPHSLIADENTHQGDISTSALPEQIKQFVQHLMPEEKNEAKKLVENESKEFAETAKP
jgi:uncharacterized protein